MQLTANYIYTINLDQALLTYSIRPYTKIITRRIIINKPIHIYMTPPGPTIQSNERIHHTLLNLWTLPLNLGQVQHMITVRYRASRSTACINFARRLQSIYNARRRTLTSSFEMSVGTRVINPVESLQILQYRLPYKGGAKNPLFGSKPLSLFLRSRFRLSRFWIFVFRSSSLQSQCCNYAHFDFVPHYTVLVPPFLTQSCNTMPLLTSMDLNT